MEYIFFSSSRCFVLGEVAAPRRNFGDNSFARGLVGGRVTVLGGLEGNVGRGGEGVGRVGWGDLYFVNVLYQYMWGYI